MAEKLAKAQEESTKDYIALFEDQSPENLTGEHLKEYVDSQEEVKLVRLLISLINRSVRENHSGTQQNDEESKETI